MWTYQIFDYHPETDGDEEAWAQHLADQGWRMWVPGPGPWVEVDNHRVRRWNLRRWDDTPPPAGS